MTPLATMTQNMALKAGLRQRAARHAHRTVARQARCAGGSESRRPRSAGGTCHAARRAMFRCPDSIRRRSSKGEWSVSRSV
jgi:hypothetical protein